MSQVATPDVEEAVGADVEQELADKVRGLFDDDYAVIIIDSDYTTFDEVERACIALFGYSRDEAKTLSMKVHTTGEALAAVLAEVPARRSVRQLRRRNVSARMEKL